MQRNLTLIGVVILILAAIWYLQSLKPQRAALPPSENAVTLNPSVRTKDFDARAAKYPSAQELVAPDGYINTSKDFTLSAQVGKKVVLIDFWTYSCINCQRYTPYLNAWYQKYKDAGLEIVGVHTPEFAFEKKYENVLAAVEKFNIKYPVVQDNGFATWDAYDNRYWPAHYIMDINGLIVERHIGEGGYEDTERTIQKLLKERAEALGIAVTVPTGFVDITQKIEAGSPETYFGWSRNEYLGNGKKNSPGIQTFTVPATTALNTLYFGGTWNFSNEYAENTSAKARIIYTYDAKNVYFVADSKEGTLLTILIDGKPITENKGADVNAQGKVEVKGARLYKLVESASKQSHTIEIIVETPGLQAFTFTFG